MKYLALSGGVGGAKLCLGLAQHLTGDALTIIANTADDFEHLGLTICPDIDTLLYTLSGRSHPEQGWGLAGESWQVMQSLADLGGPDWFRLGDKDMATHLRRSQLLAEGEPLSSVTQMLAAQMGIGVNIVPMSDDAVRTLVHCDKGVIPFQHYFVRYQCEPKVVGFQFHGAAQAQPQAQLMTLLASETLRGIIICPSNPHVSIDPILHVPGYRDAMMHAPAPVVAVSPIVAGAALKGPAAKMMAELGREVNALSVARHYQGLVDYFVLDEQDAALAPAVEALGMTAWVLPTIMRSHKDKSQLAQEILQRLG